MYFNGTGIWGGETTHAEGYSGFLGLIDIYRLVNTKNGALKLYLMDGYRRCNKKIPQFGLESV